MNISEVFFMGFSLLFSTYISDVGFQHLNYVAVDISCYKMEEQAISDAVLIIVELYRGIDNS